MAKNTIKLKKYLDIVEEIDRAGSAITPGMLVELDSNGKAVPHSDQGGDALPMFALEDELQGGTIDDNYDTEDEPVQVWVPQRGEIVYAIADSGASPSIGDFMESNGDGELRVLDEEDYSDDAYQPGNRIVGVAIEAKETDAGDHHRVKLRII